MKNVLVVSPSFPPISAADMNRVRTSLPFYREFGWSPIVLAVSAEAHGGLVEPELDATIPADIEVVRTGAWPESVTRLAGVGNVALRAWPYLYQSGAKIIRRRAIDLVYFSTTMFAALGLGRVWKARFGVPYVIDMQDAWKSDYRGPGAPRGMKAGLARWMHGVLEPATMRRVDGIISVSPAYAETLRRRYPSIQESMCATIPFGASTSDFDAAARLPWRNGFFDRADGRIHGVAVGRGGEDVAAAARLLFDALRLRTERGGRTESVQLSFIGTSYASDPRQATIKPIADSAGVGDLVNESPVRVPYLQALRLLQDAHFTVILGSDDPAYSPSKVYPYLLAGRPFVAVVNELSPVVATLRHAGTGVVATFGLTTNRADAAAELAAALDGVIARTGTAVTVPPSLLESFSARALTRRQCMAFDAALRHASPAGEPCVE